MELLSTLRRIRACEGDASAQLVLEAFVAERVVEECEACAQLADSMNTFGLPPDVGAAIRARHTL